jgi:hypothetical protein
VSGVQVFEGDGVHRKRPVVLCMMVGRVLEAEVISTSYSLSSAFKIDRVDFNLEFIRAYPSGATEICLDHGQNWYAKPGMRFTGRLMNIVRAYEQSGLPSEEVVAELTRLALATAGQG